MSTDHAPVPRVANRYGAPKPQRAASGPRRWLIWAVLAVAVVATGIFSLFAGTPEVSSKDVGFRIDGPAMARVDYEVTKDPAATAQCAVQVLNESYAVVGWTVVTIPPAGVETDGDGRTTSHSTMVRTESEGVTGGVNACWLVD
ncbi:protein of unknown function [Arthrobacter subterraneus]|uniref:DUF4307 domain-containing protein n=1 Tax=Arthrobacter subterraneus TaxID=335973 RepID=A0A1G8JCQ4_9MICC|nr:DUF4307 domain-containing protein [Arthrobacter subterraneus]SDI28410.1 protein of unknown function [Arthrobacter subterraneus]